MGDHNVKTGANAITRRRLLVGSAGLAGLAMIGCRTTTGPGAGPSASAAANPDLTIITGASIVTLDTVKTNALEDIVLIEALTDKLTRMSSTKYGTVEPMLALSWATQSDTVWRFKLREGVKFHNGRPFNAEAAKFGIEKYASEGVFKALVAAIDRVNIVDTNTIDVVTKYPTGLVPLMFNAGCHAIEPQWYTSSDYSPEKTIGTGPAKFVEWVKGQRVVMEANTDWWAGRIDWNRVTWRPIPEGSTRANAAIAGEGDIVRNILGQDVERVKAKQGVGILTTPSNRVATLRYRDDLAPFDNKLVRQALNYAVDIQDIVTNVLHGYGKPTGAQLQGQQARYWQSDVQGYPYDPDKAKSLLTQAGFPRGFTTKIGTPRGRDQGDFEFVQAVAGQLKKVGVEAEVVLHEAGEYQTIYAGQKPADPIFYYSSGNIIPDAENAFRDFTAERSYKMRSPEFTAIFNRMSATLDDKQRAEIARQGILFIKDYCPGIFGYQLVQAYAVADRVKWQPRSDEKIFLDEAKRA